MSNNFKEHAHSIVSQMTFPEKMAQLQYTAPAVERLGIPEYNWWCEGLHGVARSGTATVFPQAIAMAASFDEDLLEKIGDAISDEARAKYNQYKKFGKTLIYQGLTYWSPNINIFRDPRWGRGHETYGESPYLTGHMGAAFVRGMQGNGKYRKVDATLKHFAAHSGPEGERHSFNAIVSNKDLYETYLWAFKYCIKNASPSAVMGAYNRLNGEPCCASNTLIKNILRGEFGFTGYYVSDCGAICDISNSHHYVKNEAEAAALALNSGCDLNCGSAYKWLKTAAAINLISEDTVTCSAERLFEARCRLGMFDNDCEYDKIPIDVVESESHIMMSRKMAQESIVLLKNNGILPLDNNIKKIAVIGPNADSLNVLLGNYNGTPSKYTTLLRGIQEAAENRSVYYARGSKLFSEDQYDWSEHPLNEAISAAEWSDVVIMCMGLDSTMEGEEGDAYNGANSGDKTDLELPSVQKDLYKAIIKTGKPIIFVNVSGSAVNLSDQDRDCSAVLQCFYPGAEGGHALADILFGKVSPSGRLPVTFYRSVDDLPPFEDYSMRNRTYEYFTGKVLYPFGYGLTYGKISENWISDSECEVTNSGKNDTSYTLLKFASLPHKKLTGFKRIFLKSGSTLKVKF
jgi:beta-glucosidase